MRPSRRGERRRLLGPSSRRGSSHSTESAARGPRGVPEARAHIGWVFAHLSAIPRFPRQARTRSTRARPRAFFRGGGAAEGGRGVPRDETSAATEAVPLGTAARSGRR